MDCEYCKTRNSGDKYHEGTCANCGAPFEQKLVFGFPHVYENNDNGAWLTSTTTTVNISLKKW